MSERTNVMSGQQGRGYRALFATPGLVPWLMVALTSKLPVAMAPLALVFLVRETPGGYTLGAVLGGAYVVGEVVGAPVLGARLRNARLRREIGVGLLVGAAAFGSLAFGVFLPVPVLVVLAFVAGAAPSANPGGLRALLVELAGEQRTVRALSVETTLTQAIFAIAPALVAFLALNGTSGAPLALAAALAVAAALTLLRLPAAGGEDVSGSQKAKPSMVRTLAAGWPVYLTSAAAMALLATAELVLPALLQSRSLPIGWAGPLLAAFSVASVLGGLVYGLREWPGSARVQSLVQLFVMACFVALIAVLPGLAGIAVGLLLAGAFKSGVMVTRNLSLREWMPKDLLASGYSLMYSVQGVGYSLTASIAALLLANGTPTFAILSGAAITLVLTATSAIAEFWQQQRRTQ